MKNTTLAKSFSFQGATLEAIRDGEDLWVSVRKVCEALDINHSNQQEKLKEAPWATVVLKTMVAEDGKNRKVFCVHVKSLPLWLATIDAGRVKDNVRPKLAAFQTECATALEKHFFAAPAAHSALLERMLRFQAAKNSRTLWQDEIVTSLCKTYRIQQSVRGGVPAVMLGVIGWIYRVVLEPHVYAEMKARNPRRKGRDMHYQWWTDELRGLLDDDINVIRALSNTSADRNDFKRRMLAHYRRDALQLNLVGGE